MILGFEIFQLSRTCQKLGHFIVLCNCSLSQDLLNKMMARPFSVVENPTKMSHFPLKKFNFKKILLLDNFEFSRPKIAVFGQFLLKMRLFWEDF